MTTKRLPAAILLLSFLTASSVKADYEVSGCLLASNRNWCSTYEVRKTAYGVPSRVPLWVYSQEVAKKWICEYQWGNRHNSPRLWPRITCWLHIDPTTTANISPNGLLQLDAGDERVILYLR